MAEQDPDFSTPAMAGETGDEVPGRLDPPESHDRSLTDDLVALLDDSKTYVEAEVQYQKTRAGFALDRGKAGAFYGVIAFALLHLALVALVVGSVIALTPVIGAWAATALVAGLLVVAGGVFAWRAKTRFDRLAEAYRGTRG